MSSTFRVLFYLRRNYLNKEGKASIMIRITISGDVVQFSSKLEIEPELWNVSTGRATGRSGAAQKINSSLDGIKTAIINHYRRIWDRDPSVTAEKVRNEFLGIVPKGETLLELFDKHIEDTSKLVGISKSAATLQKHKVTRTHVANFMSSRYKISNISLKEINHMFLTDFENYLRVEAQCNANTTAKFMQFFKRIIIIARNNGWIHTDPFANYAIRLQKVDRGYLTQEEIELMLKRKFTSKRLEQVRDIFIFSCFTGLAYIDVKKLTKDNVRTSFDGNLWIMTKRQKTNIQSNILLLEVPQRIIEKYSNSLPDGILLPVLSNQKMNAYLKEIADLCGITKNMSFHQARHTFGTLLLSANISIESIAKMMGHTNISSTQIYAKITDDKISEDMDRLMARRKMMNNDAN